MQEHVQPEHAPRDAPSEETPPEIAAEMMPPPITHRRRRSFGSIVRLILIFTFFGVGIVFTLQNTAAVTVEFLAWSVTLSRALLVFLLVVVGTLLGWLLRSMVDEEGFRPLG
jgi:uncharacterized integral membrane protein